MVQGVPVPPGPPVPPDVIIHDIGVATGAS